MSNDIEPATGQQSADFEKLKNNSNTGRGGARSGAGRKPGGMNKSTKERLAIRKRFEDRIHHNADVLLNAALNKALGETYLMRKVTERDSKGKTIRVYHEAVTDQHTIIAYLDGELEGNTSLNDESDDEYYYISTRPVDMVAVKELYDRAFGKPLQKNELTGKDGEPLTMPISADQADQLLKLRAKRAN